MSYAEFRRRNPTSESKIGALTSYALTPDPKPIALMGMGEDPKTCRGIWEGFLEVSDLDAVDSPLSESAIFHYFHGTPRRGYEGSLVTGGIVEVQKVPTKRGEVNAYFLTEAGIDFAVPLAARATYFVNQLIDSDSAIKKSMWKLLGPASSRHEHKRGYNVCRVVKELIELNDGAPSNLLCEKTEMNKETVRTIVDSLADAGLAEIERFNGRERLNKPKPYLQLFWEYILCPVEIIAETLSTSDWPNLSMYLDMYEDNPNLRSRHIQRQLEAYSDERIPRNTATGLIWDVLPDEETKLKDITALLKERGVFMSVGSAEDVLSNLIEQGRAERTRHGYYRKLGKS